MNPRLIPLVLALVVPAIGTVSAVERKPAVNPIKPIAKKATPAPVHTTITSISADSITINEGKGSKTFKITADTDIELKGQKVKAEELKAGMRVSVSMGSDPAVASRINASDPPKEEPAPAAKKK